jgi:hypothetical protein
LVDGVFRAPPTSTLLPINPPVPQQTPWNQSSRRSPTHVLGWLIVDDRPDTTTLQARSALITGHNVVIVQDSVVLWTTLVHYDRPVARPIWRLVELVHRIVLPYTLTHAVKVRQHQRRQQDPS